VSHGIIKCRCCGKIISQCRCIGCSDVFPRWGICDTCSNTEKNGGYGVQKDAILCDIRQKVFDLKALYPHTPIKLIFNVPENISGPEKIKVEITEVV